MAERTRPHIILPTGYRDLEPYTPRGGGPTKKTAAPEGGRRQHGQMLRKAIEQSIETNKRRRDSIGFSVSTAKPGTYLEFESFPGVQLAVESMSSTRDKDRHQHIELVAVSTLEAVERATVFVPEGKAGHFLRQLSKYMAASTKKEKERRHEQFYDRIAHLQLATIRSLWTDGSARFPAHEDVRMWWEVWLRRTDGGELARFYEFASCYADVKIGERRILFTDRIVLLALATARELGASLSVLDDLAELRGANTPTSFFLNQKNTEQAEWVRDLASRTRPADRDAAAVCVLDTGVNRGHPLLEGSLAPEDCHALTPAWGTHDHDGHGTEMAGLTLFGDLTAPLAAHTEVELTHRLESVKILPPQGANEPDSYGALTAEAAARVEIQAPRRSRVFSMAVTADNHAEGLPTSWSSACDALAAGRSFDLDNKELVYVDETAEPRLIVVSAGNIENPELAHLDRSDLENIEDPAHAWNALTVGAYTDKTTIQDSSWTGWNPLAPAGELSPWSRTSVSFAKQWPIKPDIVMEGGNAVYNDKGEIDVPPDDLALLTTHYMPRDRMLTSTWATSAATAQAARLCAAVAGKYPRFWPETIRALVVHAAEWTPRMKQAFSTNGSKSSRLALVRRYGFGVPTPERALCSADNSATLVVQDSIRPFQAGKMRELHVHRLPLPVKLLHSLGATRVRMRVTLSYFIEPNPSRLGWRSKHRYQSHGLRFDVKRPTESNGEFRRRIHKAALDEENNARGSSERSDWFLGPQARHRGSLHADMLETTAAELAECGAIAVYPVTGWWKELPKRDRSEHGARYALIVSLETLVDVNIDIWTPIDAMVAIPV